MIIRIFLIIVVLVALFLTQLTGVIVALIGSWLFSEYRMRAFRMFQTSDDFALSPKDSQRLQSVVARADTARTLIAKARQRIMELERQGKNLRVTKSGKFDQRSKLGKKLNRKLPLALKELRLANKKGAEEEAKAIELSKISETRVEGWIKYEATRSANRIGIICFMASLLVFRVADLNPADVWPVLFFGPVGLMCFAKYVYGRRIASRLGVV